MSPLTRLVSRAWYGIRHLTTPLRSIHLPVESPRKVGTLESPLQLTRPHGWHSGALGSPKPVRGQRRHRRPHRRQAKGGSDGESGIWVSVGHQQMDTEPCKQASLPTETQRYPPSSQRSFTFRLPTKPSVRTITTSPGCRVTAPALRS